MNDDTNEGYLVPFVQLFPELGQQETRTIVTCGYPGLPDDEYALVESYCPDPACDCRRVMLNVIARRDLEQRRMRYLASIGFAFDRKAEFAGPELDPLNPQSEHAQVLLKLVSKILTDKAYVARLERHYRLVKDSTGQRHAGSQRQSSRLPAKSAEQSRGAGGQEDKPSNANVPLAMRATFEAVVGIAEPFCRAHLDEEYAQLSRKIAAALCRKRPSPLAAGKSQVWACAIVYALGSVNFLWDKTQTPHLRADELCRLFGVSKSTAGNKARTVMDALKMGPFDPRWFRPSRLDENPIAWLITVDGLILDARRAPREIQEEALRKGLIPYLPGTR